MDNIEQILENYTRSGGPARDLSRFRLLCRELNNIQDRMKYIHVAGTNGKGSVCAYLTSALIASGKKVGTFTSPHLVDIAERIAVNGKNISYEAFAAALEIVHEKINSSEFSEVFEQCSQFEVITAAAFICFYTEKVDIVVLEAGIGGTLDCTNIITPEISVITTIGADHAGLLVNPLSDLEPIYQIALHKAGIVKEKIPLVATPSADQSVMSIFAQVAMGKHSRFYFPEFNTGTDCEVTPYGNRFTYEGETYVTKMGGLHQIYNAVTAIKALGILNIRSGAIVKGITSAVIPARTEIIRAVSVPNAGMQGAGVNNADRLNDRGQMRKFINSNIEITRPSGYRQNNGKLNFSRSSEDFSRVPFPRPGSRIITILDGAHNAQGLEAAFSLFNEYAGKKKIIIAGFLGTKNCSANIRTICKNSGTAKVYIVTDFDSECLEVNETRKLFGLECGGKAVFTEYILTRDIKRILYENQDKSALITGSLYLAGCVKRILRV